MLGKLKQKSCTIRQDAINEEIFDVLASYHSKKPKLIIVEPIVLT